MKTMFVPFSNRFRKALAEERLVVDLNRETRGRLLQVLRDYDDQFYHNPYSDNPTWNEPTPRELRLLLIFVRFTVGCEKEEWPYRPTETYPVDTINESYPDNCPGERVFDVIQYWYGLYDLQRKHELQNEFNAVLDQEETGWIFANQRFHKLGSRFLEESILSPATELHIESNYAGPLEEFQKTRDFLEEGDHKAAIDHANMAYESALKAVTDIPDGQFNDLMG